MIIKSYEIKKNKSYFTKNNLFLLYGENLGLKKDIRNFVISEIKHTNDSLEFLNLYENEIINDEKTFFNLIFSGSLFSQKKIITIYEASDKIIKKINDFYDELPQDVFLLFLSGVLEKKSKLRTFFEKEKKTICVPCYLDSERDLENIAQ